MAERKWWQRSAPVPPPAPVKKGAKPRPKPKPRAKAKPVEFNPAYDITTGVTPAAIREIAGYAPVEHPMYRAEEWPGENDDEEVSGRGRFPDDLDGELLELAKRNLYRRLKDPKQAKEVKVSTLAAIVRDLGRLELAKQKPTGDPQKQGKTMNVLALVNGLPSVRQIEVLRQALEGAEEPEPIQAAIRQLEGGSGAGDGQE